MTTAETVTAPPGGTTPTTGPTYTVTWTVTSRHEVNLTAGQMAELLGVTTAELQAAGGDVDTEELADALADLDDDGFEGLTRDDIRVHRR